MMKKLIVYIAFTSLLFSCDNIICGKLDPKRQKMINNVNLKYKGEFKAESIPCEPNYVNIKLELDQLDTSLLFDIHNLLYNKTDNSGWVTLLVYDNNGKYLFSHGKNGNIYNQLGD
jgi:hypothetical protein